MRTVNMHEAKTHLSRLVDAAARGETIIIAKAGKPLVKVTAIETAEKPKRRLGFYEGPFNIPDDFDTMFAEEIQEMFEGRGADEMFDGLDGKDEE